MSVFDEYDDEFVAYYEYLKQFREDLKDVSENDEKTDSHLIMAMCAILGEICQSTIK